MSDEGELTGFVVTSGLTEGAGLDADGDTGVAVTTGELEETTLIVAFGNMSQLVKRHDDPRHINNVPKVFFMNILLKHKYILEIVILNM